MNNNNNEQITQAVICGLETLSDPEIRVCAKDVEALANFKGLLRTLLKGDLILSTPDQLISNQTPETPEPEKE